MRPSVRLVDVAATCPRNTSMAGTSAYKPVLADRRTAEMVEDAGSAATEKGRGVHVDDVVPAIIAEDAVDRAEAEAQRRGQGGKLGQQVLRSGVRSRLRPVPALD